MKNATGTVIKVGENFVSMIGKFSAFELLPEPVVYLGSTGFVEALTPILGEGGEGESLLC